MHLDVGEFPDSDENATVEDTDPYRIHRVTTHAVARIGDRFSFLRKISRHFEGKDKRAGLLSDVAAAAWELYKRNPDTVQELGKSLASDVKRRQTERSTVTHTNNTGEVK